MKCMLLVSLAVLLLCGCAVKRPIRAMYCDVRNPDSSCHTWAQHREQPPQQPIGGRGAAADE